jgi:initiation factor 1A
MGKNVFGGKNSKKFARTSNTIKDGRNKLRCAEEEGEMYAIVLKMLGNGCNVHCADDVVRICIIRGKFQGKGKSMNIIEPGSWILVGVRDWETVKDKCTPKCDMLEVYSHVDKERLKSASTDVDWDILMNNDVTNLDKMNGIRKPENVHFMTEREEDYLKTMEKAMSQATSQATTTSATSQATSQGQEKVDRVYVDDI